MKLTKNDIHKIIKEEIREQMIKPNSMVNQPQPGQISTPSDNKFTAEEIAFLRANGFKRLKLDSGITTQFEKPLLGKLVINVMKDMGEYSVDLMFANNSLEFEFRGDTLKDAMRSFYRGMKTGDMQV